MTEKPLLTTAQVAKALGVSGTTLKRWESRGWVTPAEVFPSGHRRWILEEVKAQLTAARERGEAD